MECSQNQECLKEMGLPNELLILVANAPQMRVVIMEGNVFLMSIYPVKFGKRVHFVQTINGREGCMKGVPEASAYV